MTEPALRVEHVSKRFELHQERRFTLKERFVRGKPRNRREFWALRDVSFEVPRGSFFGIVGHNGSGKSTALKILAGVYRPTSGSVTVDGRLRALLELGAGFHPELTGRENIQLNASILGMSQREIRSSIDEIVEFAGVGDFIDSPVKVYSSGMSVRLGFSIAVKLDPEILVIDEILAVGDEEFQRKCYDHLFNLRRRGKTIVVVTHAIGMVEGQCDEAIWLDHGEVREAGQPSDVVTEYIRQVNRKEARRPSQAIDPNAEADGTRRGSGDVRVKSLEMLDESGQPVNVLVNGKSYTLRLSLEARERVEDFHAAVGFFTEQGTCVSMVDTQRESLAQTIDPGDGYIDLMLDDLPLGAGKYLMSIVLMRDAHAYDHMDKSIPLTVRPSKPKGFGLVEFPARWGELQQTTTRQPTDAATPGAQPAPDANEQSDPIRHVVASSID